MLESQVERETFLILHSSCTALQGLPAEELKCPPAVWSELSTPDPVYTVHCPAQDANPGLDSLKRSNYLTHPNFLQMPILTAPDMHHTLPRTLGIEGSRCS